MSAPLRFAAIGLGARTATVLRAIKQTGTAFDLIGYADPAPVSFSSLAADNIVPGARFDDERTLLAQGPFDLLLIGSPNHLHATQLTLALETPSPVFVEKPIVRTEEESFALAERLRTPTPQLFVGLVMRSASIVREIFGVVREGLLGSIVSIDATEHLPPEHGAYLARNWRRKSEWGGSFLLDKVCRDFDILGALAGACGPRRKLRRPRAISRRPCRHNKQCRLSRLAGRMGGAGRRLLGRQRCRRHANGNRRIRQRCAPRLPCVEP